MCMYDFFHGVGVEHEVEYMLDGFMSLSTVPGLYSTLEL